MSFLKRRQSRFARNQNSASSRRAASGPQALVFNLLLLIGPLLAAQVVIEAFAERGFGDSPTIEATAETRVAMDKAFAELVAVSGDPDSVWAQKVDEQLRQDNLVAARGFLIAGPEMMTSDQADALMAAAAEETMGSDDQKLSRAALLFLPNDVRNRYERMVRPVATSVMVTEPEEIIADLDTGQTPGASDVLDAVEIADASGGLKPTYASYQMPSAGPSFDLVGDADDLSNRSARWLRDEPTDPLVLRLRGFAQIAAEAVERAEGEAAPFSTADLALGVSVITAGQRSGRLHPSYARQINNRIDAALPEQTLRNALEGVLAKVETSSVRAANVREAYIMSARPNALRRLALELELVSRIADRTTPGAAMDLIQHAQDQDDLRRLRVITEAGGDRAAALESFMGADILDLATSGVRWTRELSTKLLLLSLIALVLIWAMGSAMHNSIFHDNRGSRPVHE